MKEPKTRGCPKSTGGEFCMLLRGHAGNCVLASWSKRKRFDRRLVAQAITAERAAWKAQSNVQNDYTIGVALEALDMLEARLAGKAHPTATEPWHFVAPAPGQVIVVDIECCPDGACQMSAVCGAPKSKAMHITRELSSVTCEACRAALDG